MVNIINNEICLLKLMEMDTQSSDYSSPLSEDEDRSLIFISYAKIYIPFFTELPYVFL